jgi:starch synthase
VQLDFVFSNVMSGDGIYDNRGGFDYHLPIEGGTGQWAPLHAKTHPGSSTMCSTV